MVVFLYFLTYISLNRTQISMFYFIVWLILYNRVRQFIFPISHMRNWDCCCELSPPQQSQSNRQDPSAELNRTMKGKFIYMSTPGQIYTYMQ